MVNSSSAPEETYAQACGVMDVSADFWKSERLIRLRRGGRVPAGLFTSAAGLRIEIEDRSIVPMRHDASKLKQVRIML